MKACVVGLGKIGLPLAVQIASSGVATAGADIDGDVVAAVNRGDPPFPGEPGLEERLDKAVASGRLSATTAVSEAVAEADVVLVVVPLVVDHKGIPDFSAIDGASLTIGQGLKPGTLVLYETTVPVGTTRSRLAPLLEAESGLVPGEGFLLAFSPERVSSGSVFQDLRRYPKLVGGLNEASSKAACHFYEEILEFEDRPDLDRENGVWVLENTEAAELAKLAETVYRDVNIGLANEFGEYAETLGIDIWDVIAATNSQPYSHIHKPGISVGGHCIPVYPHLYLAGHPEAELPAAARLVNRSQPTRLVQRLMDSAEPLDGRVVVVLGAAYRGGVKETAFSGVFDLVAEIKRQGGRAFVHDPLYSDKELVELGFRPYRLGETCDIAIVHTDHRIYEQLTPADLPACSAILDGRRIIDPVLWSDSGTKLVVIGQA